MIKNEQQNVAENVDLQQPQFGIQRIYVKDLSVEVPNSPDIFLDKWEPKTHLDLSSTSKTINENVYEVILKLVVNVKLQNDKIAFLVELQHAGIFTLQNFPQDQVGPMLGAYCPNILYPYAREVVSDAVIRAGFPQLYLAPVNFETIYHQQQEQK